MVAKLALERVRALMRLGRFHEAARELHEMVRQAPDRQELYVLRARCFLAMGHLEEAERDYRWARRVGADGIAIAAQVAAIARARDDHVEACRAVRRLHGLRVDEFLGSGWEGAIYRCTDLRGRRFIVKQFHPHRIDKVNHPIRWQRRPVPRPRTQIVNLGRALQRHPHPLFFGYDGLFADGRLEALYYPYRRLFALGQGELADPRLRRALLKAALSGQGHLIGTTRMLMSDLRVGQFMLDLGGRIRYVDYGASILPVTDFRIAEERLHVLTLILLLVELFAWEEWREFSNPQVIYEPPQRLQARIDASPGLQRCLTELPALRTFIGPEAALDDRRFLDPDAYRRAAAGIPAGRPLRVLGRSASWEMRRGLRRLRRHVKQQLTSG